MQRIGQIICLVTNEKQETINGVCPKAEECDSKTCSSSPKSVSKIIIPTRSMGMAIEQCDGDMLLTVPVDKKGRCLNAVNCGRAEKCPKASEAKI